MNDVFGFQLTDDYQNGERSRDGPGTWWGKKRQGGCWGKNGLAVRVVVTLLVEQDL